MNSSRHTVPDYALDISDIRKNYKDKEVLKGVDLKVKPGEIIGILGKNGAGKSTLINILCSMISPTSGRVSVWGIDPSLHAVGKFIGYAPQELSIYPHLTVEQNLECMGDLQGLSSTQTRHEVNQIAELLGLEGMLKRNALNLSGGQKRRLHAGMALIHKPRIAFLDEPTVAADVEARNQILATVKFLAEQGTTVIYTSHYLTEFETLGARIAVLDDGRIVVDDSLDSVVARYSVSSIRVYCDTTDLPDISGWNHKKNYFELENPQGNQGAQIARFLAHPAVQSLTITNIEIMRPSLENAYLNIVGHNIVEQGE